MDLWVRIPRFPTELLDFESVSNLLASNNVGTLVKLDSRSLLRNNIRFARACAHVDISEPLLEFVEIKRDGGKVCGYNIWYEDFSSGCSFCGAKEHVIDACPLLTAPQKAVKICLLKCSKQKSLVELRALASRQDESCTRAKQANLVQAKPKPMVRNSSMFPESSMNAKFTGKKSHAPASKYAFGITFKQPKGGDHKKNDSRVPVMHGKGKGRDNNPVWIQP